MVTILSFKPFFKFGFADNRCSQLPSFFVLAPRFGSDDDEGRFLSYGRGAFPSSCFYGLFGFFPSEELEFSREDDDFAVEAGADEFFLFGRHVDAVALEFFDEGLTFFFSEVRDDAVGNAGADVVDGGQVIGTGCHQGFDAAEGFGKDSSCFSSDLSLIHI